MLNIDNLIAEAMKAGNIPARDTYRLIKTKILEYKTSKNAKPYDESAEIKLLQKMKKELQDDIEIFKGKSDNLVSEYSHQLEIIKSLLPAEVTPEQIKTVVSEYGNYTMKEMGKVIKFVKEKLPTADGALISAIVKNEVSRIQ